MTESDYINQINGYNNQISEYQSNLSSLKQQIDEAEEALRDARNYSNKFYDAVDHKKSKGNALTVGNELKAIFSWANQINEKLTGPRFKNADQSVQEMIDDIKNELNRLYAEYNLYEEKIDTTRSRISSTKGQLDTYRRNQAVEAARKAEEARAAEAARAAQNNQVAQPKPQAQNTSAKQSTQSSVKKNSNPLDDLGKAFRNLWR